MGVEVKSGGEGGCNDGCCCNGRNSGWGSGWGAVLRAATTDWIMTVVIT